MLITLHLVRHAESCANLPELKITDIIQNTDAQKAFEKNIKERNINEFNEFAGKYEDELDKIMDKKIEELKISPDIITKVSTNCKREEIELGQKCLDLDNITDKQQKDILNLRYKMIRSRWAYHPPLTYVGMLQALNMGREFILNRTNNYDIIITSATDAKKSQNSQIVIIVIFIII